MAEVLLCVTDESRPPDRFQDGDVIAAFSNKQILLTHAGILCHVRQAPRNQDGNILRGSLCRRYMGLTRRFKWERVSAREAERTDLVLGGTEIVAGFDARAHVRKRRRDPFAPLFGAAGNEIWYSNRLLFRDVSGADVWAMIEANSALHRSDYRQWPISRQERKSFLGLTLTADASDAERDSWTQEDVDENEPPESNTRIRRKRAYRVDWRALLSPADRNRALDPADEVDVRDAYPTSKTAVVSKP